MADFRHEFLDFCVTSGALRFGRFTLKSGRESPYFFNAGVFCSGARLHRLGEFYAGALEASGVAFDLLFGPAYKGIPLACATAMACAGHGRDVSWAFDRKEAKDHGEGGGIVGAALAGEVMVVDDVISSGLSVAHSAALIAATGARMAGVVVALDRQERGHDSPRSAAAEISDRYGVPVVPVARLDDLLTFLADRPHLAGHRQAVADYRARYGAS